MLQQHTSGIRIISLLALLSIRVASEEACPLRLWSHKYQPYVPELGVNSSIVVQPSSVSQSTLQGLSHSLAAHHPVYQGRFGRGLLHVSLVLPVPALRYMSWELTLASSYNPLQCCNNTLRGLLPSLSARCPVHQGRVRRCLHHKALVLQVLALRSMSWELTLASSYNPLQCCTSTLRGLLHSLSARTPVYQGRVRRGLHHVALALRVPALRFMSWELTLASSYNPRQRCNGALRGLLHSLSAHTPVCQGCVRRGLHHVALALRYLNYVLPALRYTSWELTLALSHHHPSLFRVLRHSAGFLAFSLCRHSCLSGTLQTRLAPGGTGLPELRLAP